MAAALGLHAGAFVLVASGQRPGARGDQAQRVVRVDLRSPPGLTREPATDESRSQALATGQVARRDQQSETARLIGSPERAAPAQPDGPFVFGEDAYWPRSLLSVAPRASVPIDVVFPESLAIDSLAPERHGSRELRLVLALYINEFGGVDRVRVVEGGNLPAEFQKAAEGAFAVARFEPGEVDAAAVKSQIRVEVVFHEGTLPL